LIDYSLILPADIACKTIIQSINWLAQMTQ